MSGPRPCFVYFIRPVGMDGPVKIGCSGLLQDRMRSLATWSPFPLEIAAVAPGDLKTERQVHHAFADLHSHHEWFRADPRITDCIEKLRSGVPLADAVDLTRPAVKRALGRAPWPPSSRIWAKVNRELQRTIKQVSDTLATEYLSVPDDVQAFFMYGRTRMAAPTAAQMARIAEVTADPLAHCRRFDAVWKRTRATAA